MVAWWGMSWSHVPRRTASKAEAATQSDRSHVPLRKQRRGRHGAADGGVRALVCERPKPQVPILSRRRRSHAHAFACEYHRADSPIVSLRGEGHIGPRAGEHEGHMGPGRA